jgi:hydroxymethylbilane synthase
MPPLRLGTRASALARWQAEWVAARLHEHGIEVELTPISTTGDQQQGTIQAIGGQGVFTKEIQRALLDGRIDLAVHSLKDLPTSLPEKGDWLRTDTWNIAINRGCEVPVPLFQQAGADATPGLVLAAVPQRGPVGDVLVLASEKANPKSQIQNPKSDILSSLPPGAIVGTGSLRRRAQLLHVRRDLTMKDIRGNVETRLRKLEQGEFDALILAEAGLRRLGLDQHIAQVLPLGLMLPAVGQGALGLETRADDRTTREIVAALDHPPTHIAVLAERAMLAALLGGCLAPVAALACVEREQLTLVGRVMSHDGVKVLEASQTAPVSDAPEQFPLPCSPSNTVGKPARHTAESIALELGRQVAEALLAQGAAELIAASRRL